MYDPELIVGNPGVPGFNLMAQFFYRYHVISADVALDGAIGGFGGSGAYAVVSLIPLGLTTALPSDPKIWRIQPNAASQVVVPVSTNSFKLSFQKHYDMAHLLGISKAAYLNESDYGGYITTNPVKQVNLAIGLVGFSNTATSLGCDLRIGFNVEFQNPIPLS
jgi:hypothetical protein